MPVPDAGTSHWDVFVDGSVSDIVKSHSSDLALLGVMVVFPMDEAPFGKSAEDLLLSFPMPEAHRPTLAEVKGSL